MSITVDQIIQDAQRMANRFKDLEALGNALLIEAEGNNRQIETMKQFQDDLDSLNKLARDKTNAEMVNRINQQNPSIREIRQENRELKASLEDHQRALELIMHKYREHTQHNIFSSRINFKEMCNAKNAKMVDELRKREEKITEMAAVMRRAAEVDDEMANKDIECISRLRVENQGLRELLQICRQFGSTAINMASEDKAVQTEEDENSLISEEMQENGEKSRECTESPPPDTTTIESTTPSPELGAGSLQTMKKKPQPTIAAPIVLNGEEAMAQPVSS